MRKSVEVVPVGGSVTLSCQSSPASRYQWSKAGKPYTTGVGKCVPSSGQLELKDMKQEDGGQYVCLGKTKNWLVAECIDVVVSGEAYNYCVTTLVALPLICLYSSSVCVTSH